MDEGLHRIDAVERRVGQAVEMMVIHHADADVLLEPVRAYLSPRPFDVVAYNVDTMHAHTLASQVHCDVADAAAGVEHLGARRRRQGIVQMIFHSPKRAGYGERPYRVRRVVAKVPRAAQEAPVADPGLEGGVVSLKGRVVFDERLLFRAHH